MSDQHSPGPWKWQDFRSMDRTWRLTDAAGDSILRVRDINGRYCMPDPRGPDAALIASAPALLTQNNELREALRAMQSIVNKLKACVPEYHGSPLEESIDEDLKPILGMLTRHAQEKETAGT